MKSRIEIWKMRAYLLLRLYEKIVRGVSQFEEQIVGSPCWTNNLQLYFAVKVCEKQYQPDLDVAIFCKDFDVEYQS